MKILVVTPYFYPEGGGLEKYVYNIFKRLVAEGCDITVYCSTKQGYDYSEIIDGININRLKPNIIISNTPIRLDLLQILHREIKRNEYDVINGHTPVPYFADIAAMVAFKQNTPYIVTLHAANFVSTKPLLNVLSNIIGICIEPIIFRIARSIITVSELIKYNYLRRFAHKVEIIPPGIDNNLYRISPTGYNCYGKKLLFIGSLSPSYEWKGLRILLDAMPIIVSKHPDALLTIIGDGPLKDEFSRICSINKIEKNVVFRGRVSEEELIRIYQESTLYILPSTTDAEAFPLVLLEANACGVPVVASKIGGIPYYVKDGINGFLVQPKDYKLLANKIIELLDNRDLLKDLSIRSKEYSEKFSWNISAYKTKELLEKVIDEI